MKVKAVVERWLSRIRERREIRMLHRRGPSTWMIAVDSNVMLLEMARVLLAPDTARVRVVAADLGGLAWPGKMLAAAMGVDRLVALVLTTALHWLSLGDLAEFHGAAGELLAPGGIVMNGDHMRFDSRWPTLEAVAKLTCAQAHR